MRQWKTNVEGVSTTKEPPFDPDEPWCSLPTIKKVAPIAGLELVEALRKAGVPVRSPGAKSSGLFSGGKVNITFYVPERLHAEAERTIESYFRENKLNFITPFLYLNKDLIYQAAYV